MTSSIGDIYSGYYTQNDVGSVKSSALEGKLKGNALQEASDDELMEACQEFEAYLVEQVMKQVQKSIPKSEEEEDNKYLDYFGDMILQEYSSIISEKGDLGIAQMLYDSMKNNMNAAKIKATEAVTVETGMKQTDSETAEQEAGEQIDTETAQNMNM